MADMPQLLAEQKSNSKMLEHAAADVPNGHTACENGTYDMVLGAIHGKFGVWHAKTWVVCINGDVCHDASSRHLLFYADTNLITQTNQPYCSKAS